MACLDTNVIIDYINGNEKVRELVDAYAKNEGITTTIITKYELLIGRDEVERQIIRSFLNDIKVYPLEDKAAEVAANIRRKLKLSGSLIRDSDILIAGISTVNDETLITQDRDFERIKSGRFVIIK
ncbi:MAG: type II toxin-antitoxin system VapC family toxin [Candidatus Micrarchaeota archaeon]|nr:type II toxin-antitoxin system VapC family toxin [Candidatus Micrarchaeota archaeon]